MLEKKKCRGFLFFTVKNTLTEKTYPALAIKLQKTPCRFINEISCDKVH